MLIQPKLLMREATMLGVASRANKHSILDDKTVGQYLGWVHGYVQRWDHEPKGVNFSSAPSAAAVCCLTLKYAFQSFHGQISYVAFGFSRAPHKQCIRRGSVAKVPFLWRLLVISSSVTQRGENGVAAGTS